MLGSSTDSNVACHYSADSRCKPFDIIDLCRQIGVHFRLLRTIQADYRTFDNWVRLKIGTGRDNNKIRVSFMC